MKKWLAALMLTLVFSASALAATKEEFAKYVLMARTGQMKSEIRHDTDEIRAKFFYLGDEPVETSVVVLEVRFFTSNISSSHLSMTAQKQIDESRWKELRYEIELWLDQEKPFVRIFYSLSRFKEDPVIFGDTEFFEDFAFRSVVMGDVVNSPYGQTDFQTYQDEKKAVFWENIAGLKRMWFVDTAPYMARRRMRDFPTIF
ncbi:MAG: hypothetical protein LBQ58_09930 [Synergistaceae bacterium]|nr:hypothetical protein [Synergistaceae bacterium]